jgi:hypothetical protein
MQEVPWKSLKKRRFNWDLPICEKLAMEWLEVSGEPLVRSEESPYSGSHSPTAVGRADPDARWKGAETLKLHRFAWNSGQ